MMDTQVIVGDADARIMKGVNARGGDAKSDLEKLFGEKLVPFVEGLEHELGVEIDDDDLATFFESPTPANLGMALKKAGVDKTAYDSHANYMRHRQARIQTARRYRQAHMAQIRKKSRIYRRKVARRQIRPRRRIGSRGSGYSFVSR